MKIFGYKLVHIINPVKWYSIVIGKILKKYGFGEQKDLFHIYEQYTFRATMCNLCLEEGKCLSCKCDMPDKMLVPFEMCDLKRWGPIIQDKEQWENFKKENKIKITAKSGITPLTLKKHLESVYPSNLKK